MSISTNSGARKRIAALLLAACLCAAAPSGFPAETPAEAQTIIDVAEGHILLGDLTYMLSTAQEKPIAIGMLGGETLVVIYTPAGSLEMNLGKAPVALTERAVPYVTELRLTQDADDPDDVTCPICGRSTAVGNHSMLPCGHYGCLKPAGHLVICTACHQYACSGKDHSICASCGQHNCAHENLICEYTRNPAPSPYTTKTPEGKTVQGYISDDKSAVNGKPNGVIPTWAPAKVYDALYLSTPIPTPKPNPWEVGGPIENMP